MSKTVTMTTTTVTGGVLRLIKSDTGKSLYIVGDTKPVRGHIKAIKDLAFDAKWNNKKQAWNLVPKKGKMDSVLSQLRDIFELQAQQAEQMPEVSGSVAWVQPPPKVKGKGVKGAGTKVSKAAVAAKPVKPTKKVNAAGSLPEEAIKAATGASKAAGGMNVGDIKAYLKSIGVSVPSSAKRADLEQELKKLM